jgi:hypothetical protein
MSLDGIPTSWVNFWNCDVLKRQSPFANGGKRDSFAKALGEDWAIRTKPPLLLRLFFVGTGVEESGR